MNTPIFVIIPVYNGEKYLEAAASSVLNQPNASIQLILVNDGSKDSSGDICDRLSKNDPRVSVIHQKNSGVSKARNAGIELALEKCERLGDDAYIAFLDADDFWKKDMKWHVEEDADLIGFSSVFSNAEGKRFRVIQMYENSSYLSKGVNTKMFGYGPFCTFFYRAGFLRANELRFMEGVARNEDVIFFRQAFLCARKVYFSSEVLYFYRMNAASTTHRASTDHLVMMHIPKAWNSAMEWVYSRPDMTEAQRKFWTEHCGSVIGALLLENARLLAQEGFSAEKIKNLILDTQLSQYLDDLQIEWLADWQKDDLVMYRRDLNEFVSYHRKTGKRLKFAIRISKNPIVRKILDWRNYDLLESDIIGK